MLINNLNKDFLVLSEMFPYILQKVKGMVLVLQISIVNKYFSTVAKYCGTRCCVMAFLCFTSKAIFAQADTIPQNRLDTLLSRPKGLLGHLTQALLTDTGTNIEDLQRNDIPF